MSYTYGVVHALVECEDCDWNTEAIKMLRLFLRFMLKDMDIGYLGS